MDNAWEQLDNPEANAKRAELIATGGAGMNFRFESLASHYVRQAKQEQEVLDKRELIEQLAAMVKAHKARAEEIEQFAEEHDIPGVCGWSGIENFIDDDIVENAIRWAASNHNC